MWVALARVSHSPRRCRRVSLSPVFRSLILVVHCRFDFPHLVCCAVLCSLSLLVSDEQVQIGGELYHDVAGGGQDSHTFGVDGALCDMSECYRVSLRLHFGGYNLTVASWRRLVGCNQENSWILQLVKILLCRCDWLERFFLACCSGLSDQRF